MNNCIFSQIMMLDSRVDDESKINLGYEEILCKGTLTYHHAWKLMISNSV